MAKLLWAFPFTPAALRVEERSPADPIASLDVAELCLALGRFDEAAAAFTRLRSIDDEPEHEVYAYHGLIEVEILRGRMRRALDLTVDATKVDRLGRTTDVLAFVVAQVFGERDRPSLPRPEVEALLASSRTEHRRLHIGGRVRKISFSYRPYCRWSKNPFLCEGAHTYRSPRGKHRDVQSLCHPRERRLGGAAAARVRDARHAV